MAEDGEGKYLIVWEFRVRRGIEAQFEQVYGPNGKWAQLFSQGQGYVRTELHRDTKEILRYLTLDTWTSRQAYEEFREAHAAEYAAIDAECERMTTSEVEIGRYERVG